MNKVLIGVMSCERDSANGCHDVLGCKTGGFVVSSAR